MSNYLRDILGAGSQTDSNSQPLPLIAADIPNIPGGTGANKGFWEFQLRDKEGNWAEMGGDFTFELEIEGLGRITGHGKLMAVIRPGVGLLRVTNHPVLGDRDIEVTSDDISAAEAIIPDADYERVTGKKLGPRGKKQTEAAELKDEISGDEALKTIRSYVTSSLKKEGRFPIIRSDADIEKVVSEQYKSFFDQIKQEDPELLKVFGREIPNADLFWEYIKANYATDLMTRYMAPEDLPPLMKRVNQLYAEKFLGLKKDGLISFYRNNIRGKDTEADAAAGYSSLDKYMAFDYNVDMGKREGGPNTGRYEIKAKPDEINGLLGFSRIGDEIGAVISPEVTAIPGRVTRLGDLEIPDVDSAPWLDLKNIEWDRSLGSSPFRQHRPLGQFDYYGLDKDPFGGGNTWASFYEAHGLEKGAIPGKYDELYGEGSWERDFKDLPPMASQFKAFFTEYTDVDGSTKWGLRGDALWNIGMGETDLSNPKANDGFEKNIKLLSTMQELMGTPFFVSRGHHQDDPRVPTKPVVSNNLSDLGVDFQTATMDADGTRLPTPGAFTGKFQEIVAGAKDWKEVQERLKGQTITYFDFETTGISDYDGDGIKNDPIQLGAVQVKDGQIVKRFNLYVNPGSKLSYWSATKLQRDVVDENGKRVVDEEGKPDSTLVTPDWLEQQVSPEDAVRQFIEFIGPEALVGGQNVPFDLEILRRMANSAGVELDIAGTIDSKDLASLLPKYDPEKGIDGPKQVDKDTGNLRPSSSLGPVANFLGFEPANWHSADGDAEDSYNLVSKIIDRAANEDSKDLRLLDFPEMEKQYKKKMEEFKAVVSKDNPITERQKKALTEFADSKYPDIASVAKEALSVKQTRGQAAQLLEKINEVNDKRSVEKPEERKTGIFNEYSEERADQITAEDTPLTDLGWEPDEEITIYRGVPDDVDSINPGDWVTTLPQLAQDYAGAGGKVISSKVKAKDLFADPSSGEGAYTEEMVYRPASKPAKSTEAASKTEIDTSGTRLSDDAKEELNSLISSFNTAKTQAITEAYKQIASDLGRSVSMPWDKDRTPEGRETYEYISSAEMFDEPTPRNDEEKELLRIKNILEEKLNNNKDLQEAKKTLYSNKLYKDVVDALNSEINDFTEDGIEFGLMDVRRNLSRPRPRLTEEEIDDFSLTYPDFGDQEVNDLVYDITIDLEDSVEVTNKDLKDFAESGVVSVILPMSALKDVMAEGRMKTVHETRYSQAGNPSEEYRALRVAYESLAFGYGGDSPMEERPVYGLLRSATHPMPEDALMIYGGRYPAQIVLKPEVKTRTTISDRDSLNHFEPTTPLTDPKFDASYITRMVGVYREATGENFFESENFAKYGSIEAQVHGGVKLDDIGKVLFYETPPEEIRELLTSKGIIWEVSKQQPYSKPRSFGGGIF